MLETSMLLQCPLSPRKGEVTTDMGVLAPSTDEEDSEREGKSSSNGFIMSPAVGVLVGVVVALVVMALIIVIVMRIQSPPPTRSESVIYS
ncbi:hypothetical protein TNCV_4917521 [Trichonephila clavipes]|nr:hypothetical protein TNCV_4917521 [Trichonephila clavipes]